LQLLRKIEIFYKDARQNLEEKAWLKATSYHWDVGFFFDCSCMVYNPWCNSESILSLSWFVFYKSCNINFT